jgi:thiol-disulfide isomerase/thioredoxin
MYVLLILLNFLMPNKAPSLQTIPLKNLQGKEGFIDLKKGAKGTAIFFLSPECPLCQSYSLTIQKLEKKYAAQGIQFIAIIPGKYFTVEEVVIYRNKYQLKALSFWFDPNTVLSNFCEATITPEVVVYRPGGQKVYQGRIDNWAYELSKKRAVITEHDLNNVLEKPIKNEATPFYKTKSVGCFIN